MFFISRLYRLKAKFGVTSVSDMARSSSFHRCVATELTDVSIDSSDFMIHRLSSTGL